MLKEKQFGITFTPHVNNASYFKKGYYFTSDIHHTAAYLQPFMSQHPLLQRFIDQINLGNPLSFTLPMRGLIRSILNYDMREGLASYFLNMRRDAVNEICRSDIRLMGRIDNIPPSPPLWYFLRSYQGDCLEEKKPFGGSSKQS